MSNTYNTIKVKKFADVVEEFEAAGAIYPGMLVEMDSNGKVVAHNSAAARACIMIALENELEGEGIDDAYASGDKVQVWFAGRGDMAYMVLSDGEKVVKGDMLESNGDGYLQKLTTGYALAVAEEAVDLSGSSGEESSEALGYNKRILVRIM